MKIKIRGFSEWILRENGNGIGKKLNASCCFEAEKTMDPFGRGV